MLVKSFRLFVSSTFADFAAERELLQSQVFPTLDAYCATKGFQFYPLDLRWGISEEAGRDQRTAEICLEEVEAASGYPPPNFMILLGDRYGWVPLPFAIARDEFVAILDWLDAHGDRKGASALHNVYRLDENRLVPRGLACGDPDREGDTRAYTLRSREDDLPELKQRAAWKVVEDQVRAALQTAAKGLVQDGRLDEKARDKYVLSLTEREIRQSLDASAATTAGAEAIAFVRKLDGLCDQFRERDPARISAVAALKERVQRTLADDRIACGSAICDAEGNLDAAYLAAFATAIKAKLKEAIDRHIAKVESIERGPGFALCGERKEHLAFRAEKLKVFVGRESNLDAIARYVASDTRHPLVLFGPSGAGKSALMAQAVEKAQAAHRAHTVERFIGASAGSSDLRALLISLIDDLADHGLVERPAEYDLDTNKFPAQIKALLASVSASAMIFLDALDQLRKPYRLDWLPDILPVGVRLVLSVLDDAAYDTDSEVYRQLRRHRLPDNAFLAIEPLTRADGRDILLALEARARRQLRESQRDLIIRHFEAAGVSPLYLRTAFEIARCWRSWEANAGRHVLAADTSGLIGQFMADLISEQHHASELVTRTLGFLAAAKDGLSEKEITEVLARDSGVMAAITPEQLSHKIQQLPPFVWVRLHRALKPFLFEKRIDDQPLLHFFHRQVADVAHTKHYERVKAELHAALAQYFDEHATKQGDRADKRILSELPYQLHHAGGPPHAARLNDILLSPEWMQQKLVAFASPLPLIEDYNFARTRAEVLTGQTLEFVADILARDGRQLAPQLLGRLGSEFVGAGSESHAAIEKLKCSTLPLVVPPALVPRWPSMSLAGGAELTRFQGHVGAVVAVAFAADGQGIASCSLDQTLRLQNIVNRKEAQVLKPPHEWMQSVAMSSDFAHIAICCGDSTVRLWAPETGETHELGRGSSRALAISPDGRLVAWGDRNSFWLWNANTGLRPEFLGHDEEVYTLAFSSTGRYMASGSWDKTVRLWDVETGKCRAFVGHSEPVSAVSFSLDERTLVSGSLDTTLRLWNLQTAECLVLNGHTGTVLAAAFSPDGCRVVSGSDDQSIRLWDTKTMQSCQHQGHGSWVCAIAFSPNGRQIVSGSLDRTVRLWDATIDLSPGAEVQSGVRAVSFSPTGRYLASGDLKQTLELWDIQTGRSRVLEKCAGRVLAIAFSSDGRLIATGSRDPLLRIVEVENGTFRDYEGHTGWVSSVAFSPNGQFVVSGSDDGSMILRDCKTGEIRGRHAGDPVRFVTFSIDGRRVISGTDETLSLWDIETGILHALRERAGWVRAVAANSSMLRLASGSYDDAIQIWDAQTEKICTLNEHEGRVNAVAFLQDGTRIITASDDQTVRMWDSDPNSSNFGSELTRLYGDGAFLSVATSICGRFVAAGDSIGRVHILDWISDDAAKATWLARFDDTRRCATTKPAFPPNAEPQGQDAHTTADNSADDEVSDEMRVTGAQLAGARYLETYRGRHLFALTDGRVYLDGLIAVASLDHARATLDHMAETKA